MGFLYNLRYCLRMLTNTEIAAAAIVVPGWVGMDPKIGSAGREDRPDGRSSTQTGRKPSRYWDAAVPVADSSASLAANAMSPSPSISAGSVISGSSRASVQCGDGGAA